MLIQLLFMDLRHSHVSERLGRGDIETTLKDYTHVLKELRIENEQLNIKTLEQMIV